MHSLVCTIKYGGSEFCLITTSSRRWSPDNDCRSTTIWLWIKTMHTKLTYSTLMICVLKKINRWRSQFKVDQPDFQSPTNLKIGLFSAMKTKLILYSWITLRLPIINPYWNHRCQCFVLYRMVLKTDNAVTYITVKSYHSCIRNFSGLSNLNLRLNLEHIVVLSGQRFMRYFQWYPGNRVSQILKMLLPRGQVMYMVERSSHVKFQSIWFIPRTAQRRQSLLHKFTS